MQYSATDADCELIDGAAPSGFEVLEVMATRGRHPLVTPAGGLSQITAVLEGTLEPGPDMNVAAGHLVFTPPQWPSAFHVASPHAHMLVVRLDPTRLDSFAPYFPQPWREVILGLDAFGEHPHRIRMQLRRRSLARNVAVESAVLAMIAAGSEIQSRLSRPEEPEIIRRAVEFIAANLGAAIGLQDVAAALRVSRSRLAEVFREERRTPVGDFIRTARLHRACELLRKTPLSLQDIAMTCGFYDQSHMCRLFREHLSTTPHDYRRDCASAAAVTDPSLA